MQQKCFSIKFKQLLTKEPKGIGNKNRVTRSYSIEVKFTNARYREEGQDVMSRYRVVSQGNQV
ncbi:hypothetical protein T458_27030 [Brevibacillus panacihumi W25]|uniref:Uncharacterized protein n=1 Tax=Brevibacillus panacihumi W25 TaxID=1408254 RepID=V6M0T5_9BACL|nr:hypothetical protein T458_27030 [Brevibacillus panacihumi W25]